MNAVLKTLLRTLPTRSLLAAREARGLRTVLLACFPKSGSTFVSDRLAALAGCRRAAFLPVCDRREQELEEACLLRQLRRYPGSHLVAQQHVRLNAHTAAVCERYGIRSVVLTRNLMDCLVSLGDHWDRESCVGPHGYWTPDLVAEMEGSSISRLHAITLTAAPWYVSFYLSWYHWRDAWLAATRPLFVRYEEFFAEPERGLTALASQLGIPASGDQIAAALANGGQSRFNRGVSGRGAEAFRRDPRAYAALRDLLAVYPSIDFSPIFTPLAGGRTDRRPLGA
jgi:hypothetical protein